MNERIRGGRGKRQRRQKVKPKGIFCLEGDWWGKIARQASVEPALEVLHQWDPYYIPYVHRDVATRAEFDHDLSKWCQKGASKYPILYLAFHGDPGVIYTGDRRKGENTVSLDELEDQLEGACSRRIIHFGSCSTIDVNGNRINRFLRNTGALAVCGFREAVYWLDSTAFELVVFGAMQLNALTLRGARAMRNRIMNQNKAMAKELGFRMVVQ